MKDKANTFPCMCRPLASDCDWSFCGLINKKLLEKKNPLCTSLPCPILDLDLEELIPPQGYIEKIRDVVVPS